jgi:hypothetical protein
MADQDSHKDRTDENARKASTRSTSDRDESRKRDDDSIGEPDDVAEDRNLSGASTWLNLPDQPSDKDSRSSSDRDSNTKRDSEELDDDSDRASNR